MRGPGLRVSIDVRRTWRCARCGYLRHAPATETTVRCHCTSEQPWMTLVEPPRKVRPQPQPLDLFFDYEPDPDELPPVHADEVPQTLPANSVDSIDPTSDLRPASANSDAAEPERQDLEAPDAQILDANQKPTGGADSPCLPMDAAGEEERDSLRASSGSCSRHEPALGTSPSEPNAPDSQRPNRSRRRRRRRKPNRPE